VILKGGTGRRACHSGTAAPRLTASLPSVRAGLPDNHLFNAKREPRFAISTSLDRETIDKFFTFTWTASRRVLRAGRQATTECP
jgi:hypothetical protein